MLKKNYQLNFKIVKKNIIFIAGGGDEIQSKEIDSMFAKRIDGKKVMYIPVALNRDTLGFEACYDWLTGLLLKFTYEIDVPQIHMYLDPLAISESMSKYDAIYIGGGNTFKFLDFIYKNNLFEKIKNFSEEGGLIYGGSAGAIIFGSDINTVEEENNAGYVYSKGFDVLGGMSFICHYNEKLDSKIFEFVSKNKKQVIALPEESGLVIVDGKIEKQIGKFFLFNEKGKNPFLIKKKL